MSPGKYELFCLFCMAFFFSSALTPLARELARALNVLDHPGERKIHTSGMPRLGGMAIAAAFAAAVVVFVGHYPEHPLSLQLLRPAPGLFSTAASAFLAGSALVFLVGLADDYRGVGAAGKLVVQMAAAAVVLNASPPLSLLGREGASAAMRGLDAALCVLWICFATNAFNLIDGLDGLASGTAFLASSSIAAAAYLLDDSSLAILASVLAGASLGFLKFNYNPSTVFMGDCGSLFLGFSLATFTLKLWSGLRDAWGLSAAPLALLPLALPVCDASFAVLRRLFIHGTPLAVFKPDERHIHHIVLARFGGDQRKAANLLYLVSLCSGMLAVAGVAGLLRTPTGEPPLLLQWTIVILPAVCYVYFFIRLYGEALAAGGGDRSRSPRR